MENMQKLTPEISAHLRRRRSRRSKAMSEEAKDPGFLNMERNANQQSDCHRALEMDKASPKTFEFVTITRPSDVTSTEISKKIRVQAMRDYIQKQNHTALNGNTEVTSNVKLERPALYKGRFKLSTWSHQNKIRAIAASRQKSPIKKTTVGKPLEKASIAEASDATSKLSLTTHHHSPNLVLFFHHRQIDPFDSLSIKLGRNGQGLLAYYQSSYSMNSIAINSDGDFFSYARTDPALLHSVLFLVALHRDLKLGISDSSETLSHGCQAFRIINQRLQEGTFSDMTIASVAILATKENLRGNFEASAVHMRGLECMVKRRGGIHKMKGVLARVVTWSDFCYANVVNCQPRFPQISFPKCRKKLALDKVGFDATILAPEDLFNPDSPMVSIFSHLRILSFFLDPSCSETLDRQSASEMIYVIEYALLHLNKRHAEDVEPGEDTHFAEAVPLKTAAHLWLYLWIREIPRTSHLLCRLVQRLQAELETHVKGWWGLTCERQTWLLWMLFMGGAASTGAYERWWFVTEMEAVCRSLGISSVEGVEKALKRVLWRHAWCWAYTSSLWNDFLMLEEQS